MFYTAQCRECRRVVACRDDAAMVEKWLNQGLIVQRADFKKDEPRELRRCQFCGSEKGTKSTGDRVS